MFPRETIRTVNQFLIMSLFSLMLCNLIRKQYILKNINPMSLMIIILEARDPTRCVGK